MCSGSQTGEAPLFNGGAGWTRKTGMDPANYYPVPSNQLEQCKAFYGKSCKVWCLGAAAAAF